VRSTSINRVSGEGANTATVAEEEYLQSLFWLQEAGLPMTGANLSRAMQLSAPTVHEMVGRLEHDGYITRASDRAIAFTASGAEHAEGIVRRHRLIERFLTDILGVPWDEVHEEAERLEHVVSERLEGYIDRSLGYSHPGPARRSHRIPRPDEPVETLAALASAPDGCRFSIRRVSDADPAVLRFLGEQDIRPGTTVTVVEHSPFDGPVWIALADRDARLPLPPALARAVYGVPVQSN